MAATIIALNVVGWGMLAAVVGGHYHITRTEIFGFGTGILAYTLGMRHVFVLTWAVALSVWHFGKIEQKWDTAKAAAPD
jgi:high-affinity nickel permease